MADDEKTEGQKPRVDYASNSKKEKDKHKRKADATDPERQPLDPVVSEPAVIKKPGFGRRMKDWVIDLDAKTVTKYVLISVIVPGVKSILFDTGTEALRRTLYKDTPMRRGPMTGGPGPRTNYQTPVVRSYGERSAYAPHSVIEPGPRQNPRARRRGDFYLPTEEDCVTVLDRMGEILEQMDVVTVLDLYDLMNRTDEAEYTDQQWGWTSLLGSRIVQTRDGYFLEFPPAKALR